MAAISWVTVSWVATASSKHRGVQRPAGLALEDPGLVDHRPHRVEDPFRRFTGPQLVAPQREHRRVEPGIVERPARRHLPRDVHPQLVERVPVREPFNDCSTITVAITSAGTDGRPRPDGNRSANKPSGNNRSRCSAKKACTDPPAPDAHTTPPHPTTHDWDRFCLAPHSLSSPRRKSRAPHPDCSADSSAICPARTLFGRTGRTLPLWEGAARC